MGNRYRTWYLSEAISQGARPLIQDVPYLGADGEKYGRHETDEKDEDEIKSKDKQTIAGGTPHHSNSVMLGPSVAVQQSE